jgi:hypothetical protein
MLNLEPYHQAMCSSGGITPRISNLSTSWRYMVILTQKQL